MDRIEKARFAASEQRARMLGRSAAREAGHSTLPARLYPLERALRVRDLPNIYTYMGACFGGSRGFNENAGGSFACFAQPVGLWDGGQHLVLVGIPTTIFS